MAALNSGCWLSANHMRHTRPVSLRCDETPMIWISGTGSQRASWCAEYTSDTSLVADSRCQSNVSSSLSAGRFSFWRSRHDFVSTGGLGTALPVITRASSCSRWCVSGTFTARTEDGGLRDGDENADGEVAKRGIPAVTSRLINHNGQQWYISHTASRFHGRFLRLCS